MQLDRALVSIAPLRSALLVPLLAAALTFGGAGSVAEASALPAPAQSIAAAPSGATGPVLADWDDHHCDGDRDWDDWGCRFDREHHRCDGDHGWDDWFCGWRGR
jgi:hypothetical protein